MTTRTNSNKELIKGRTCCSQGAWKDAYPLLAQAAGTTRLNPEDLELLATSAYLVGQEEEFREALEAAHRAYMKSRRRERAARCAFWLGLTLMFQHEMGRATGWLARARRLVDGRDCAEHGYLMLPLAEQHLAEGHPEKAQAVATEAVAIGERFGDPDLAACALHLQGRALMAQSEVARGVELLDETMVAVSGGELSPIVTGLIYCSVIEACRGMFVLNRAREWTAALSRWCNQQSGIVAFTGTCLVHRAEIMQLDGAWDDALAEACFACDRFTQGLDPEPPAGAFYRRGEIHRLRGEFDAAERAFKEAGRFGWDPQPGLALLRLAQGRLQAAQAAIRRALAAAHDPAARAALLPACVETMLAADTAGDSGAAVEELEQTAATLRSDIVRAMAAQTRGAVEISLGRAQEAMGSLRLARRLWENIKAPYEIACVRARMGVACRALGDEEAAASEFAAARSAFSRLRATPDLARIDKAAGGSATLPKSNQLTRREREVLLRIAAGKTNKAIAAEMHISLRTVDRHVSNILSKLGVASRAAATARAFAEKLF